MIPHPRPTLLLLLSFTLFFVACELGPGSSDSAADAAADNNATSFDNDLGDVEDNASGSSSGGGSSSSSGGESDMSLDEVTAATPLSCAQHDECTDQGAHCFDGFCETFDVSSSFTAGGEPAASADTAYRVNPSVIAPTSLTAGLLSDDIGEYLLMAGPIDID